MVASCSTAGVASSKKHCLCKACRRRPVLTHISTRRPSTFRCRMGHTHHLMRLQRPTSSPRSTIGARRLQCWWMTSTLLPICPALTHRQTALLRALKEMTTVFSRHLQQEHMQQKYDDDTGLLVQRRLSTCPSTPAPCSRPLCYQPIPDVTKRVRKVGICWFIPTVRHLANNNKALQQRAGEGGASLVGVCMCCQETGVVMDPR